MVSDQDATSGGRRKKSNFQLNELTTQTRLKEEPYDPHMHRNLPRPTSNYETLFHIIRAASGTGILAMPKAFQNSGLILGVFGTIFLCSICTYCLHILVKAQYELCKRLKLPVLSYRDSMVKALERGPNWLKPFAKHSAVLVDVLLIVDQLGMCCVNIIFVAGNLKAVFDAYVIKLDIRVHLLILMLPVVLMSYVRDLKRLAPLSAIGNVFAFTGLSIILYFSCKDQFTFDDVQYVGEIWNIPLFVGTTLFAVDAIGVAIACENNMKTPKSFGGYFGVLNQGMFVITVLYVLLGFFGYLRYKSGTQDSITLNLDEEGLAVAVQLILSGGTLFSYMLLFYIPVDIMWNTYLKVKLGDNKGSKHILYEYMLRTSLALATLGFAMALPNLGDFISLFGAVCLASLGIAFPALIDLCVKWPDNLGLYKWVLLQDLLLIILAIFAFLAGTYCSLFDIIRDLESELGLQETAMNSTTLEPFLDFEI